MQQLLIAVGRAVQRERTSIRRSAAWASAVFWAERIGFLCGIRQALVNPYLYPEERMHGKLDRPEEYCDNASKCVEDFCQKKLRSLPGGAAVS